MRKFYTPVKSQGAYFIGSTSIGTMTFALVAVLVMAIFWLNSVHDRSAALEYISGRVLVSRPGSSNRWRILVGRERVHAGQQIQVEEPASARLVFNNGSRVILDAGTQINLVHLDGEQQMDLRVAIVQKSGETRHQVLPLRSVESDYIVVTPFGFASTRGASFSISVDQSGYTRFSVDTGVIVVHQSNQVVTVTAGQAAVVHGAILDPDVAYQFTLTGILPKEASQGWSLNGVAFEVTPRTRLSGDPQVGSRVQVEGRILDGKLIADRVQKLEDGDTSSFFTGVFRKKQQGSWQVGGVQLATTANTSFINEAKEGDAVLVVFTVKPDGTWVAKSIIDLGKTRAIAAPDLITTDNPGLSITQIIASLPASLVGSLY